MPYQDNENAPALLLGTVTVQRQVGQLTYSDPLHTNLLASMSRLPVTEQDASNIPLVPSPNPGDWRYTAAIDNIKTSGTPYSPYSLLDHLRHLLSEEPTLKSHGLHGGVITWLQHDISKLVVWSISARDDWQADGNTDPGQIRRQLIRILFELDGDAHAPLELPANTAYTGLVDMPAAKIALLPFGPLQNQFSLVDDIYFHLQGVAASPGVSPAQKKAAANISVVINQLNTWLGRVLHDDRLLLAMNDQQLGQHAALSLLDDMQLNATYAFSGHIDQVTGNMQEGAQWVYQETQHLATIEVMPAP